MKEMGKEERCFKCDKPTGKAGIGDDSLTTDGVNPLCEGCFDKAMNKIDKEVLIATLSLLKKRCPYVTFTWKGKTINVDQAYNQLVKLIEDSEPKAVDEELIEQMEFCISYPYDIGRMRWRGLMIKAKQLLSQKPQDYEQNLTDCTEAIDALIEERDALIEDLEHRRVVTREELSDLAYRMKERAEVGSLTLTNYHAVIKWVARELGIEVAGNTQNLSSENGIDINEGDK